MSLIEKCPDARGKVDAGEDGGRKNQKLQKIKNYPECHPERTHVSRPGSYEDVWYVRRGMEFPWAQGQDEKCKPGGCS